MRKQQVGGATISYPDELAFAFSPCLVVAEGVSESVEITLGDLSFQASAYGGSVIADFRELVQAQFDGVEYDVNYSEAERTPQGKRLEVSIIVDGSEEGFTFSAFFVWGALFQGETWNGFKELVCWKCFPFAFGLYDSGEKGAIVIANDGAPQSMVETDGEGIYNFVIPNRTAKEYYDIWDYNGTFKQATFDETFDLTFRMTFQGVKERKARIWVRECCYDRPVYLRWVDRHGFWRHWLFKKGDEERAVTATGEFMRNNLRAWDGSYGYSGGAGRRHSYGREDTINVCAPLVDGATFDLLQDITTSPVVDMYLPEDEKWVAVTIKDGTFTKTGDTLQDFAMQVVLRPYDIQTL